MAEEEEGDLRMSWWARRIQELEAEQVAIRQALNTEFPTGGDDLLDCLGTFVEHHKEREQQVATLKDAIRKHRDMSADDRCHLDDYELYAVLGEPIPESACRLDDPLTMLGNCVRFVRCRHDPSKPYRSPMREIEKLQQRVDELQKLNEGLVERCAGQSELLTAKAAKQDDLLEPGRIG